MSKQRLPLRFLKAKKERKAKGKILAVKWGLNPNSSSLGVDVTFLLLGATALSVATPIVSALVRLRLANKKKNTRLPTQSREKGLPKNDANLS